MLLPTTQEQRDDESQFGPRTVKRWDLAFSENRSMDTAKMDTANQGTGRERSRQGRNKARHCMLYRVDC